jgi:transposase
MKNLPGKRTDWQECQWIQYLHWVGLLHAALRPAAEICAVRALMRHRGELVTFSSQHVQHMQKALTQMNVPIQHVISDLTGLTGMAIVDAILGGERNPDELVKLRDPRIQAEASVVRKSLLGNWRAEHLFTLRQSRDLYRTYQQHMVECDQELERYLKNLTPGVDPEQKPLPPDGKKHRRARRTKKMGDWQATSDLRTEAYRLFGVDVMQIPGLENSALRLFSEVGRDLSAWPTAHHFASWCGLCPDNDRSGGKVLWTGVRKIKSRVGQMFRLAAHSLHPSLTPMGNYLRRLRGRLGARAAITATAHKIAIIFYTLVNKQVEYDESIWALRDAPRQRR